MKKMSLSAKIRRFVTANPNAKAELIANKFNTSKAYVYVVRAMMNKESRKQPKETANILGVTMAKEDVAKLTPEQFARLAENATRPRQRMQATGRDWETVSLTTSDTPLSITMEEPAPDMVNHPAHYKSGGIETIDFIEAKKLNYHLGNVVKYITRADLKGDRMENLKKAKWYLDREIERAAK